MASVREVTSVPTAVQATTAEQLALLPDTGMRYELVQGELQMMSPAGHLHGRIAMRLGSLLEDHVRRLRLGTVYAAETGFLLSREPDTVRAPDVAFVSKGRLAGLEDSEGYLPLAPDLVGEVVSPSDTFTQVEEKAMVWLAAGTRLVLVADPGTRTVRLYRSDGHITIRREQEKIDVGDVVRDWTFIAGDVFS